MQALIPSDFSKKEKPFPCKQGKGTGRFDVQFPAVVPAVGEVTGSVGLTGATVVSGVGAVVGAVVAAGERVVIGAVVGAVVGIAALPLTEQVQPTSSISSASSGIKKNRFIMRISFRFFSDSMSRRAVVIRLRHKKIYAILDV